MSQKVRDGRRGGHGKPHGHSSFKTSQKPDYVSRSSSDYTRGNDDYHKSKRFRDADDGRSYVPTRPKNHYNENHFSRKHAFPPSPASSPYSSPYTPVHSPVHIVLDRSQALTPSNSSSTDDERVRRKKDRKNGTTSSGSSGSSGSGNGYDNGKPKLSKPAEVRHLGAETGRVTKRRTFGAVCRGDGRDSIVPRDKWDTAAARPFSHMRPGIAADDAALVEERDAIRQYLLATYPNLRHDTPNLAYLVERCVHAPNKDLHPVIRTHAFSNLMQYGDLGHVYAEVLHFCAGISQCRGGGQGIMSDDVVMCDCDGHVPQCFIVAFTNLLRDYVELKESCEKAKGFLQKPVPVPVAYAYTAPPEDVTMDDAEIA